MTYLYFKTLQALSNKPNFSGGFICHLEDDIIAKIGYKSVMNLTYTWLDIEAT